MLAGRRADKVLALLRDRATSIRNPPGRRLGLVVEGGGMRGVISAGVLVALESLKLNNAFDAVYGTSAGALNSAYFLARQAAFGCSIYYRQAATSRFINPLRLWKMVDIDYLFDEVIGKERPLDTQAVLRSRSKFVVAATDGKTGAIVVWDTRKVDAPLLTQLKASSALPVFYNKQITVAGRELVDGGLSSPFPVVEAIDDGCTDLLVVMTRPFDHRSEAPGAVTRELYDLLFAHGNRGLLAAFDGATAEGNMRRRIVRGQEPGFERVNIAAICPTPAVSGLVGKFSIDRQGSQRAAEEMAAATLLGLGRGNEGAYSGTGS